MPVEIRPKREGDSAALLAIARGLGEWFNADGLARMERDLGVHEGLVAVDGEEILGFATWSRGEEEGCAEMTWLAVARPRRGRGIGTALCDGVERSVALAGLRSVFVSTLAETIEYEPYEATRRFYLGRGYRRVRVDAAHWGEGNDRLLLRLDLDPARDPSPGLRRPAPPPAPRPPRYETLDAWRGVACLGVVAFHAVGRYVDETHGGAALAPLRLVAQGGWLGVPLFFTISGYCIAASARAASEGPRPTATFFLRRFRRIYPTFWIALALAALLGLVGHVLTANGVGNGLWDRTDIGWHWLSNATLVEEPLRLVGVDPEYGVGPTWSLCYEEQFYAFMGICFVAVAARRVGPFAFSVATSAAAIALAAIFGAGRLGPLTDVWPLFAFGIWAHERSRGDSLARRRAWDAWAGGTAALMLAAYAWSTGRLGQEAKQVVICAAFALLLVALRPRDATLAKAPIVRGLRWVGARSYSIYLIHFPIVMSLGDTAYPLGWTRGARLYATAAVTSGVAVAVAIAFHRVVERRFLMRRI